MHLGPIFDLDKGVSGTHALGVGATFAVLLIWLALGTVGVPTGPDWHGNVAPTAMIAIHNAR